MRVSKAVFVIGLILLVLGVVIALAPMSTETWDHKEQPFVEEVLTVSAGFSLFPFQKIVLIPESSKNIAVSGTVRELNGKNFDFYIFNKRNYELWVANASYQGYGQAKDTSSYSVAFSPTRDDAINVLYFVVVNKNPFLGPSVSVEFSIKISWDERSYSTVLGGLVVGGFLGGLGFLLIIVSAVMAFVFGRSKQKPIQSSPVSQVAAGRFCTVCGASIPGNVKFCTACGLPRHRERESNPVCAEVSAESYPEARRQLA